MEQPYKQIGRDRHVRTEPPYPPIFVGHVQLSGFGIPFERPDMSGFLSDPEPLFGVNALRRFPDKRENAGEIAVHVHDGAVVQVGEHVFRLPVPLQDEMLIAVRKRLATAQYGFQNVTVEICHLGPAA
jgi:hypothetical protein